MALCTGNPLTCSASYCLCRSPAYFRPPPAQQQTPYQLQQVQAFFGSLQDPFACAAPSPAQQHLQQQHPQFFGSQRNDIVPTRRVSELSRASTPVPASAKKQLKRAASVCDELTVDGFLSDASIASTETTKSKKRTRRNGEAGDSSKDPKYVLTTEMIDFKGQQYCRVYRRPPISYADLITYAIAQSPLKKLKLQAIYIFLISTFGYFKHHTAKRGWENSIRHNLSMKSRGRFLKVKDSDDSEKGSYWHLNRDPNLLTETMENARETADRLESWQGILYLPIRQDTPHPLEPMLFSEEDRHLTEELCVLDEAKGTCIRFKSIAEPAPRRKSSTMSTCSAMSAASAFEEPLPTPPFRNLIAFNPNDDDPPLTKAERKRKRNASPAVRALIPSDDGTFFDDPMHVTPGPPTKRASTPIRPRSPPTSPPLGGMIGIPSGDAAAFDPSECTCNLVPALCMIHGAQHRKIQNQQHLPAVTVSPPSPIHRIALRRSSCTTNNSSCTVSSPLAKRSIVARSRPASPSPLASSFVAPIAPAAEPFAVERSIEVLSPPAEPTPMQIDDDITAALAMSPVSEFDMGTAAASSSSPALSQYDELFGHEETSAMDACFPSALFGAWGEVTHPMAAVPAVPAVVDLDLLVADPAVPVDSPLSGGFGGDAVFAF